MVEENLSPAVPGMDSDELAEWYESLDDFAHRTGLIVPHKVIFRASI